MNRLTKNYHIGSTHEISCSLRHLEKNIPLHFHEFYEIEYVLMGNGTCVLNGEVYPRVEGMLFFMTPLDCHELNVSNSDFYNVMFTEHMVPSKYLEHFLRYSAPKAIPIEEAERPFFSALFKELTENGENREYCISLLSTMLLKLEQLLPVYNASNLSDSVSKMYIYTMTNFQNKITLEQVAAHAGLTPAYASALFKKEMQINFKALVDSLRFDLSRKLLLSTNHSVAKICEMSGFEDVPNFTKRFKKHYGLTPSELRRSVDGVDIQQKIHA